jgi:hypothetical protein
MMKVKVNFDGSWLSDIELGFYRYSGQERVKKSIKTFLFFFGLAIISILIPVLHFVLVPLFLILSFFLSYRKYKELISLDLTKLSCPGCNIGFDSKIVELKGDDQNVRLICNQCRKTTTLQLL